MECKLPKKDHTSMKHMTIALLSILILVGCCACGQEAAAESMPTWQEHYDLGVRYLSEGNYDEAIIAFTAAIEIDPKRPEAYLSLADAYTGAGAMNAARKALEDGFAATGDLEIQTRLDDSLMEVAGEPYQQPLEGYPRTQEVDYGDGRRSLDEYDSYGNMIKNTQYDTATGALLRWAEYSYDEFGQKVTESLYNPDGTEAYRMTWEYNADGICTRQTYTCHGPVITDVDEYDDEGNLLRHLLYDDSGGWLYSLTEYGSNGEIIREVYYNPDGTEREDAY